MLTQWCYVIILLSPPYSSSWWEVRWRWEASCTTPFALRVSFIVWTFSVNRTWFKDTSDTFGGVRPFIGLGSQSVSQSVWVCGHLPRQRTARKAWCAAARPLLSGKPRFIHLIQLEIRSIPDIHIKNIYIYFLSSFILIFLSRLLLNLFPLRAQQAEA